MSCHTQQKKLLKLADITPVNELYKSEALKFAVKCGAIYELDIHITYGLLAD